jgi:hypothetical protein
VADQCNRCGRILHADRPPQPAAPQTGGPRRPMLDNPWFVLGLLFFAMAICGLPLLWKSRGFSRFWKIALSLIVTLYTILLIWGFWLVIKWSWSRIIDAL